MLDLLSYQFFQNALLGAVLSSIVCGIIGSYIVSRRLVFLSGGITHASFGGIGIALFLGGNPIVGALIAAISSVIGVDLIKGKDRRDDAAIAAIWALGMSIGVLFMTLTPGYNTGITSYLFGNILLIDSFDLIMLLICSVIVLILFCLFYKSIIYSAFDRDFATTRGHSPIVVNRLMLIIVAVSLVLSIRLVGIMLLMSLLTLPQMIMARFTSSFKTIAFGSVVISLVCSVSGLIISSVFDSLPSGAIIILCLFLVYTISLIGIYPKKTSN